jgi:hypothetical protein
MSDFKFDKMNVLEKVRNLLNRAEGTDSEHERNSCMDAATKLMEKYSIAQAELEASGKGDRGKLIDCKIPLTNPYADEKVLLLSSIARNYRCRMVILNKARGNRGIVNVHLFGYEDDLEWTALMFQSLLIQQAGMMVVEQKNIPEYETLRRWRSAFMGSFAMRINERLAVIMHKEREESNTESTGVDLILYDRKKMVSEKVQETYPKLYRSSGKSYRGSGANAGTNAANNAHLGQTSVRGTRGALNA